MDLRQDGDVDAVHLRFDGRTQTGQTAPDHYHVMMDHLSLTLPN
jgi:hypothetical protein